METVNNVPSISSNTAGLQSTAIKSEHINDVTPGSTKFSSNGQLKTNPDVNTNCNSSNGTLRADVTDFKSDHIKSDENKFKDILQSSLVTSTTGSNENLKSNMSTCVNNSNSKVNSSLNSGSVGTSATKNVSSVNNIDSDVIPERFISPANGCDSFNAPTDMTGAEACDTSNFLSGKCTPTNCVNSSSINR